MSRPTPRRRSTVPLPTILVLGALALGAGPGCGLGYLVQQSAGQIAMLSRRQPIAEVLRNPRVPPAMRDRLVVVWYARRYAERTLGLRASESYHDVVLLDRDAASYVVAAAAPDSLEPYRWCFPVAGCLPYIGYFDRADARREQARLVAQGYDVAVRGVAAYSLGGWLPDPIYSPMLDDSRGEVANTVIHELTHGTVFFPGRARFNEGLATFVGDHGALQFLAQRYGARSATLAEARAELADGRLYRAELHALTEQLTALYGSAVSRAEKLQRRTVLFAAARERIARLPFATARYARARQRPLNNAVLATNATYFGAEGQFDAVYTRLGCDLPRFVAFVRDEVARHGDPEAFIAQWLARPPAP